jgi:hypothetical protein
MYSHTKMELLPIEILKLIDICQYRDFVNFRSTCKYIHLITLTWTDRWKEYMIRSHWGDIEQELEFYLDYYERINLPLPEQVKRIYNSNFIIIRRYFSDINDITLLINPEEQLGVLLELLTKLIGNKEIRLSYHCNEGQVSYFFNPTEVINDKLKLTYIARFIKTSFNDIYISTCTPIKDVNCCKEGGFYEAFRYHAYCLD